MIYLANPSTEAARTAMTEGVLGCVVTPKQGNRLPPGTVWAADNGCGPGAGGTIGAGFPGDGKYLGWLADMTWREGADPCDPDQSGCLFAVAPDVVADASATLRRAATSRMLGWIRHLGYPVAFAIQDGQESLPLPWDDLDAVFIGGSTEWKLGPHARRLVAGAVARGKHVHMGRVNSLRRLRYAAAIGCDSADGTFLAFAPDQNLPRLLGWLRDVHCQAALFGAGEAA